jgi:hypothetical protein
MPAGSTFTFDKLMLRESEDANVDRVVQLADSIASTIDRLKCG